ncbi:MULTISPECIES: hypothetical protein [unclassified Janibacter]|uniref:hypothetical protein n=1 Tax=unclassified Janibacter TaxID=2649294 RepID=UPI003CFCBA69
MTAAEQPDGREDLVQGARHAQTVRREGEAALSEVDAAIATLRKRVEEDRDGD